MSITCSKVFGPFPFAHRQHSHDGHCALIHGHNWKIEIQFSCMDFDDNGFVIDFGKLDWLKKWLEERFDHTLVLNRTDPGREYLESVLCGAAMKAIGLKPLAKITLVHNCGAEGIARQVLEEVNILLRSRDELAEREVRVSKVTVWEDEKNFATIS